MNCRKDLGATRVPSRAEPAPRPPPPNRGTGAAAGATGPTPRCASRSWRAAAGPGWWSSRQPGVARRPSSCTAPPLSCDLPAPRSPGRHRGTCKMGPMDLQGQAMRNPPQAELRRCPSRAGWRGALQHASHAPTWGPACPQGPWVGLDLCWQRCLRPGPASQVGRRSRHRSPKWVRNHRFPNGSPKLCK